MVEDTRRRKPAIPGLQIVLEAGRILKKGNSVFQRKMEDTKKIKRNVSGLHLYLEPSDHVIFTD